MTDSTSQPASSSELPLKRLQDILIDETQTSEVLEKKEKKVRRMALNEKTDEYLFKLGYSNAQIIGILLQLLTVGKIQVVFSNYVERLEVVEKSENLTRNDVVQMYEAYVNKDKKDDDGLIKKKPTYEITQKIIVQKPRQ